MENVIITDNAGSVPAQREELIITDHKSGCNWIADLLGNSGAVTRNKSTWLADGGNEYIYQDEEGNYHMTRDQYEWWAEYITGHEWIDEEIAALDEMGATEEQISDAVATIYGNDMGDEYRIAQAELGALREMLESSNPLTEAGRENKEETK